MNTYNITITKTQTLTAPIEANSPAEALIVALEELRTNGTNLTDDDWTTVKTRITTRTDGNQIIFLEAQDF